MITEDSFVRLMHDLGDVDAPPSADRLDGIHHKIKKVRMRRTLTAAVAVIAIVAAGLAVASLRNAPPAVPADMPRSWTASDGVTYKLVRVVTLDTAHQNSITVPVPATTPMTLRYTCASEEPPGSNPERTILTSVTAGAGANPVGFSADHIQLHCGRSTPTDVDFNTRKLPTDGRMGELTIEGVSAWDGGGDDPLQVFPARWTVGIYTWVIPAILKPVSTLPPMPQIPGYRLATTRTTVWPQKLVSFQVPAHTTWGTIMTCSDTFEGAVPNPLQSDLDNYSQTSIDGHEPTGADGLGCSTGIYLDSLLPNENEPAATTRTVTITFTLDPIYLQRNGVFEVGVYYKD